MGARILKAEADDHAIRLSSDDGWHEIVLVAGKKRSFVWFGPSEINSGKSIGTFSGAKTLRKFAQAILDEIPE